MNNHLSANSLICGMLAQETIINLEKECFIDIVGGNLLYTAYSFQLWKNGAGLAARVGENFPVDWLTDIQSHHFNTSAIHRLPMNLDLRAFYAFLSEDEYKTENPQKYFSELGLPFPKSLLGYAPNSPQLDNRKTGMDISLRSEDIPADLLIANSLYLAPLDFYTHSIIPPLFRSNTVTSVMINPPAGYMHSSFFFDVPTIFRGATAVITTLKRAESLFLGRSKDIWEMAETIANYGVELVAITAGKDGQYIYDHAAKKKYHLPAYPVDKVVDTIGANDAFGGGFFAGYLLHFDPIQAALIGNISASIKVEGSTPRHLQQTLPELAAARLEYMQGMVEEC